MSDCYTVANDLLRQAIAGINYTGIMRENTDKSVETIRRYLSVLVESKLLEYDKSSRQYQTTINGHRFIHIHGTLNSLLTGN